MCDFVFVHSVFDTYISTHVDSSHIFIVVYSILVYFYLLMHSLNQLADMCYAKYGKFHDMCVKNSCISKGNTRRWVALNVYIGHLGQKSFPMTSAEYVQKLESVAQICTGLRQSAYVRQFFAEPPIPRRGLPSRPRTDTAVSLRLNRSPTWNDDIAEEFFST